MGLLRRLLQSGEKRKKENTANEPKESKYMPENKLPTDEFFMRNFIGNGGKFLYCSDTSEVLATYQDILAENTWENKSVFCYNPKLQALFGNENEYAFQLSNSSCILTTCEYLIADTGALLVTSNQIGEKKLAELPNNFIIFAKTSQLINSIGEGLQGIKNHHKNIPTNITTMKTFDNKKESDFMSYGSTSKNLYLLLLEDL